MRPWIPLVCVLFACATPTSDCEYECTTFYEPVCGLDGRSYDNECHAFCANTTVDYPGACVDDGDPQDGT